MPSRIKSKFASLFACGSKQKEETDAVYERPMEKPTKRSRKSIDKSSN